MFLCIYHRGYKLKHCQTRVDMWNMLHVEESYAVSFWIFKSLHMIKSRIQDRASQLYSFFPIYTNRFTLYDLLEYHLTTPWLTHAPLTLCCVWFWRTQPRLWWTHCSHLSKSCGQGAWNLCIFQTGILATTFYIAKRWCLGNKYGALALQVLIYSHFSILLYLYSCNPSITLHIPASHITIA